MRQKDVNAAFVDLIYHGESGRFEQVLQAIRDGDVTLDIGDGRIVIKVVDRSPAAQFGARLAELRQNSGRTFEYVAGRSGISISACIRYSKGLSLGQWPMIAAFITACGGDPAEYRDDYERAKHTTRHTK